MWLEMGQRWRFSTLINIFGILGQPITDVIRYEYEHERDWIRKRIKENRERYPDETDSKKGTEDELEIDVVISREEADTPDKEYPNNLTDINK